MNLKIERSDSASTPFISSRSYDQFSRLLINLFIDLYQTNIFKDQIVNYLKLGLQRAITEMNVPDSSKIDKNDIILNNKRLNSIFSLMGGLTDCLVTDRKVDEFRYTIENGIYPDSFLKVWNGEKKPAMKMPDEIVDSVKVILENVDRFTERTDYSEPVFHVIQKSLEFTILAFLKFQTRFLSLGLFHSK